MMNGHRLKVQYEMQSYEKKVVSFIHPYDTDIDS